MQSQETWLAGSKVMGCLSVFLNWLLKFSYHNGENTDQLW